MRVQPLVGELRSHMLSGAVQNKVQKKSILQMNKLRLREMK